MWSRRRFSLAVGAFVLVSLAALAEDPASSDRGADQELWQQATLLFKPLPEAAPNPENPLTAAKVELGKMLYFDRRLSKEGNISCNSCHALASFGVDNLPTSPGDDGGLGGRNSPTVLNAALHTAQFWDGRAADVEEQAGMPILNPVEMAIPSEAFLVDRLAKYPDTVERFAAAFPNDEPALTYRNISRALAAFERTLLTPSRFDDYLRGDQDALTEEEKEGLETFLGFGCVACHNGINLGGHTFRKFGLNDKYWHHTGSTEVDEGRFAVTGDGGDKYVFKVASLRNVEKTYPYFHDGSVSDLAEAIRVMTKLQVGLDPEPEQVDLMVAFLKTLTGKVPDDAVRPPDERSGTSP